ncbi:MAG: F0F1 ATP synthase subunit B [Rhodocyclaceae bacterium]|nr:F0F1 ATP synthase subunit B [Rhodocyclaceae bacterium]MBK9624691.1 F0F1 ATP synthase subunit B [Rhodocyclaceae bacterium]MBL0077049.1 F0F1 ATP synthase subunit B [Rhodocyclaceae bacterium]MBP6109526.1 F0F1 ATP synthase subunit B [Rhodocyclaceae bacterium]
MNLNGTLLQQVIVFFILGWFTMKFVWPPIMKALDERRSQIADGLAAADKAKADSSLAEKRIADELRKARESAAEFRSVAERQVAQLIEDARNESARIVKAAREAAETEAGLASQRAKEALREQVATLAVAGAERILRKEINAQAHAELLSQLKSEL